MALLWSGSLDWLAVALVVLGAIGFTLGRRGWRSERLLCGRCFHALAVTERTGLRPNAKCPECGADLHGVGGVRREKPSALLKSLGLICCALGVGFWLWNGAFNGLARLALPRYVVKETQTVHGCEVVISQPRWREDMALPRVEVRQAGRTVFASTMSHPSLGGARVRDPFCADLVPLLWIRSDSGGSLGLSQTFLFRPGVTEDGQPDFLPYAILSEGAFAKSDSGQLDPDVWVAYDIHYAYWLTTGANSPSVALRGTPTPSGIVWLDPDPSDAPDQARLDGLRAKLRALATAPRTDAPAGMASDQALGLVLDPFIELVYAGRAPEAWAFLRAAYDDGLGTLTVESPRAEVPRSLEALEGALVEQMQRSKFIDEVLRRNRGSIAPPPPATLPANSAAPTPATPSSRSAIPDPTSR